MSEPEHLAERRRLLGLAYRITGVWADAEEVVSEAYARLLAAAVAPREPAAWLTTVTTRLAIDRLRARQREAYIGPWLPEPIDTALLPEESVIQQQTLRLGLLALCEQLAGTERAAFVLREAYAMSYREIALVLGIEEATARQHLSRARKRLQVPDLDSTVGAETEALNRLAEALASGDVDRVAALLTDDAQLWTDGGGMVTAARNVIRGAQKCARFLVATVQAGELAPLAVNGRPGVDSLASGVGRVGWVVLHGDRVSRVCIMANPDKLTRI